MSGKLRLAVIGCGDFAQHFVALFKAHPMVEKVWVCDLERKKAENYAVRFGVETEESFETVLQNGNINSVAIFVQRHLHGPFAVKALKAGKHVYSAVPMASSVEECQEIVELVKQTGLTYMMGETCVYYPCSMYCKEQYEAGAFGKFVYGEAQYHHDISHFPPAFRADRSSAGVPPFFYPTHSTAMILNAVGSYVTRVVGMGYRDSEPDDFFREDVNQWGNVYSNEYSLMQLKNGGTARINECRRIGYKAPSSYISGFYGTEGSYQFMNAQHIHMKKTPAGVEFQDVSARINTREMEKHRGEPDFMTRVANHGWQWGEDSPMQAERRARLPESFRGLDNGHMGSHQLLVDDFCTAAYFGKMPCVNAWQAARFTIPGLLAHESILRDSLPIAVPDCGDAPE